MSNASQRPASAGAEAPWTTRSLLAWMTQHFASKGVDSPRLVAEMLLSHVLACDRMRLYMEVDRPANQSELATLRALVARAARHEPVQYLVGEAWFYGRKFAVDPSTLIPRPSTETLVEHVVRWLKSSGIESPLLADVGTGTGCIAICVALHVPACSVIATDVVPGALALAKRNAEAHGVGERIEFRAGDGVGPLKAEAGAFDVICSNPPYIPDHEWPAVADNVRLYEPETALRGGADGLAVIRPLVEQAPAFLKPGGMLAIEIADSTKDAVHELAASQAMLCDVQVLKDFEGLWRVVVARRAA